MCVRRTFRRRVRSQAGRPCGVARHALHRRPAGRPRLAGARHRGHRARGRPARFDEGDAARFRVLPVLAQPGSRRGLGARVRRRVYGPAPGRAADGRRAGGGRAQPLDPRRPDAPAGHAADGGGGEPPRGPRPLELRGRDARRRTAAVRGRPVAYTRATRAIDRTGRLALGGLVAFLLAIYVANLFGPPPPSGMAAAWSALAMWLLVAWGYWVDRHRATVRA